MLLQRSEYVHRSEDGACCIAATLSIDRREPYCVLRRVYTTTGVIYNVRRGDGSSRRYGESLVCFYRDGREVR